jgi:hypothetical protein
VGLTDWIRITVVDFGAATQDKRATTGTATGDDARLLQILFRANIGCQLASENLIWTPSRKADKRPANALDLRDVCLRQLVFRCDSIIAAKNRNDGQYSNARHHLTMIRRKFISPISAVAYEFLQKKRKHGFSSF